MQLLSAEPIDGRQHLLDIDDDGALRCAVHCGQQLIRHRGKPIAPDEQSALVRSEETPNQAAWTARAWLSEQTAGLQLGWDSEKHLEFMIRWIA